jgi:hypothetical protein
MDYPSREEMARKLRESAKHDAAERVRDRLLRDAEALDGPTCSGCWRGSSSRRQDGSGADCDACGLPGAKPEDYEYPPGSGKWVTHYINHGNTWQPAPRDNS